MFHAKTNTPATRPQAIAVIHFCFVIFLGLSATDVGVETGEGVKAGEGS
jgi:hypothetical protein